MHGTSATDLAVASTVATLLYASYRDLRSREVPELTWAPAYIIATVSLLFRYHLGSPGLSLTGLLLATLPSAVYAALFIAKLIGGADLLAMALICLVHLGDPLVPLLTYMVSSIAPLPLILVNLVTNALVLSDVMRGVRCVSGSRKLLYLIGRPVRVSEFLDKRFAFLHTYPTDGGFVCSSSVDVDVDFEEQRRRIADALSRGLMRPEDYVVYSPAIPHVVLLSLSYVTALLVAPLLRSLMPFLS